MANATQTTLASGVKQQYEKRLLMRAVPRLVHGNHCTRARLNKYGSNEWRRYGSLPTISTTLTEGTTPGEQAAPTITAIVATPSWYGSWIGHSDELELTIFDPYLSEISGILGEQAGVSVDTIIRNALTNGATIDYSAGQTARANLDSPQHDITYADIVKGVATLEGNNALPVEGDSFVLILHPHSIASLMTDPTFVAMFQQAGPGDASNPMRSGYIGRILRCNVYVTSNAREFTDAGVGGTTDVYSAIFIGREAYGCSGIAGVDPRTMGLGPANGANMPATGKGQAVSPVDLIVKPLGSAGADDPLNQRGSCGWKTAFDTQVLNNAWLLSLEHTNQFSDD
jgi:N4-gp56 family major capsid protein